MSNEYVKQLLQEIQDNCREHEDCKCCKIYIHDRCVLASTPDEWSIDKIGKNDEDKWYKLYDWLNDTRLASAPEPVLGPSEYTARKVRLDLIDEIMEYMEQLEEEEDNET
jgi:hypothetical protein